MVEMMPGNSQNGSREEFLSSSCFPLSLRDKGIWGHRSTVIPALELDAAGNDSQQLLRNVWSLLCFTEICDKETFRQELDKADKS